MQPIDLMSANTEHIVTSDNFKHSDDGFKYFIGQKEDEIVKPLCIILSEMSGYINILKKEKKKHVFHGYR